MPASPAQLLATKRYREKHPERVLASMRKWREANRETAREATRCWAEKNPEKASAACKAYREANPGKTREWARQYRERNPDYSIKRYGVSLADFIVMAVRQEAKCAICGVQTKLCVDHCHTSGKVRGLLCRRCNAAIGLLKDSLSLTSRAAKYLGGE